MHSPGAADTGDSAQQGPIAPPVGLLVTAAMTVGISVALFPLSLISTHVIGYVLGSFVTITLVALYRSTAQRRRRNPYYSPRPGLRRGATLVLAAGTIVAAAHVWVIATHLAS